MRLLSSRKLEYGLKFSRPIEIIIGLFILLFLAALCFPIITSGRNTPRRDSCISNVKELSLGVLIYIQDYDEHMPPAAQWMDLTFPSIKDVNIYRCPEIHSSRPADFGYAFNSSLSLQPLADIAEPGTTPMIYDSNLLFWNAHSPGLSSLANPPRHSGSNNIGYTDGHAKHIPWPPAPHNDGRKQNSATSP